MTTGTNDTYTVKKRMGERLKRAREELHYNLPRLADLLNEQEGIPVRKNQTDNVSVERLKKWESGENPIAIEWIPILCDVLQFDVGYLFGEYEQHYRVTADISEQTGLTEMAVRDLVFYKGSFMVEKLSELLSDKSFWEMLNLFEIYKNMSPEIAEKNKETVALMFEAAKNASNEHLAESYKHTAYYLDELRYRYRSAKMRCHVILDDIINRFLPDI